MQSASVFYGKATAYLPVIELLRGYFEIESGDDPRRIREKITCKLLTLDRALEPTLPALLDVPGDEVSWHALGPDAQAARSRLASTATAMCREMDVRFGLEQVEAER